MYSVDIRLPTGTAFGKAGMRGIQDVLEYVRGAMKPGGPSTGEPGGLFGATVVIDGPTDSGTYMVARSLSGQRKLYKVHR